MGTPHKAHRKKDIKTTGRALVGVGVTGAVAFTGAGLGQAQPHIDSHRTASGAEANLDALLKQLAHANQDLATLNKQLGRDRERANKALVDLQRARAHAVDAKKAAAEAAVELAVAHDSVLRAQQQLNAIAADAYRNAATSSTTLDLMSGEDPDSVVAREAVISRAAAQQGSVVDELKQARAVSANRSSQAKEAASAAEAATQQAVSRNHDAESVLLAAQTAVNTKQKEIKRLTKKRTAIAKELRDLQVATVRSDTETGSGVGTASLQAGLEQGLYSTGTIARAAGKTAMSAHVDVTHVSSVADLAKLPVEALQSIPESEWRRLGSTVQTEVAKQSPEAAVAAGVAEDVAIKSIPHLSLVTRSIDLLASIPDAIEGDGNANSVVPDSTTAGPSTSTTTVMNTPGSTPFSLDTLFLSARQKVEKVVRRGMSQLGVPYAWGGGNVYGPTRGIRDGGVADSYGDYNKIGFDCSGLMVYAFAALGYNLPHYSGYQYTSGLQLPVSQMKRGDMIFYGPGGSQHVALYLGDGMMLEAPYSGEVVKVNPVRWDGMSPFVVRMVTS